MATRKRQIRAELKRLATAPPDIRRRVVEGLSDWLDRHTPATVVGFLAMGDEIDMAPLVEAHADIRFALTRTTPSLALTVHPFEVRRERHRFGFDQPAAGTELIDPSEVDVVLVPGLGFDRSGRRLGRGAGYYDRFLAGLAAEKIGLTTESRLRPELPAEPHDVLMDWIATEEGVTATD